MTSTDIATRIAAVRAQILAEHARRDAIQIGQVVTFQRTIKGKLEPVRTGTVAELDGDLAGVLVKGRMVRVTLAEVR